MPQPDGVTTTDSTTISGGHSSAHSSTHDNSHGTQAGSDSSGDLDSNADAREKDQGFAKRQEKNTAPNDDTSNVTTTTRADSTGYATGSAIGTIGQLIAGQLMNLALTGSTGGSRTLTTTRTTTAFTPTSGSRTVVTRTDKGSGKNDTTGTTTRDAGDADSQHSGTGSGNQTAAADIVYSHYANIQEAGSAPRYHFETASGTISASDYTAFDEVFNQYGGENYNETHANLVKKARENGTDTSGWHEGSLIGGGMGHSAGETITHTIGSRSTEKGAATVVQNSDSQSGAGGTAVTPGAISADANGSDTVTLHKWIHDVIDPAAEYSRFDRNWSSTLTSTTKEPQRDGGQVGDPPPTTVETQVVDWKEETHALAPVTTDPLSYATATWLETIGITPTAVTQQTDNVETGNYTQTVTNAGNHQSVVVDRTHEKNFQTVTGTTWTHDWHGTEDGYGAENAHAFSSGYDRITDTETANDKYHYDSEHDVLLFVLATGGVFHATDVRHGEVKHETLHGFDSEGVVVWGSSGYPPLNPGVTHVELTDTISTKTDDNVEEHGTYYDVLNQSLARQRLTTGHATSESSKTISHTVSDVNKRHYNGEEHNYPDDTDHFHSITNFVTTTTDTETNRTKSTRDYTPTSDVSTPPQRAREQEHQYVLDKEYWDDDDYDGEIDKGYDPIYYTQIGDRYYHVKLEETTKGTIGFDGRPGGLDVGTITGYRNSESQISELPTPDPLASYWDEEHQVMVHHIGDLGEVVYSPAANALANAQAEARAEADIKTNNFNNPQPPATEWEAFGLGLAFGATEVGNVALRTVTFGAANLDDQAGRLADAAYLDENTIRLTRLAANVGVTAAFAAATPSALARLGTVPGVSRIVASPVGQLIGRGLASRPVQGAFLVMNGAGAINNGGAAIAAAQNGDWIGVAEGGVATIESLIGAHGNAQALKTGFTMPKVAEDPLWKDKIDGSAHGSNAHKVRTYREAIKAAKDPNVESVHLNHGYNRALELEPKTISPNRRPDVTIRYKNGTVGRIEVFSKTDDIADLMNRNLRLNPQILGQGFAPLDPQISFPTSSQ